MRKLGVHNYMCETPTPGPLCRHVADWLHHLRSRKYSPRTVYAHWNALKTFEAYLMERNIERPHDVRTDNLEAWRLRLIEQDRAAATVTAYMGVVVKFFRHLEARQVIFNSPGERIVQQRGKDPIQPVPSMAEMQTLLAMPDVSHDLGLRDRALLETLYSTGARLEEITRLTLFDPDLERGVIQLIGKGDKERTAPLGKQAIFWLGKYIREARPKRLNGKPDVKALWIGRQRKPRIRKSSSELSAATHGVPGSRRRSRLMRSGVHALRTCSKTEPTPYKSRCSWVTLPCCVSANIYALPSPRCARCIAKANWVVNADS